MLGDLARNYLKSYLKKTDPIFKKYLQKKERETRNIGELPADLIAHFAKIARRGKKIRGSLVTLGYELGGGNVGQSILDTSLFVELIHSGLLIHDDIQDQDVIRRGLPTIHKLYADMGRKLKLGSEAEHYGESMAINIGACAYFLGYEKLLSSDFPSERLVEAGKLVSAYIARVTHGETLDVANIFLKDVGEKDLLSILRYKSAEYTGVMPLLVGATLAGLKDQKKLIALKKYGLCLGWAFQIQDDILGAFGDESKFGKSVGIDFKEGKVTLLMLHLAKNGNKEQKQFQKKVLGNEKITQAQILQMQQILKRVGSFDYVLKLGWRYVKKGEKSIPAITRNKKLQKILKSFLYFMMERTL